MLHTSQVTHDKAQQPPKDNNNAHSEDKEILVPVSDLIEERHSYQAKLERHNSALRRYQDELEKSRAEYRKLFELAPLGYFVFDEAGIIYDANLTAVEMLQKARRHVLHKSFLPFLKVEDKHQFQQHLLHVIETGERQSCDVCVVREDGSIYVEIQSVPIDNDSPNDEQGDNILVRSAMMDITVRRQMEEELISEREKALRAVRFMNEFLANMSHEIRTPLAGVIGFAEVLEEELPPEYREIAQLIASGGNRLLHTLNSVLDFARLRSHDHRLLLTPINVVERVRKQCQLLSSLATQKNLKLHFECEEEHIYALLDDSSLDRVLNNLIGNAIKYTKRGEIRVKIVQNEEHFEIKVMDTGIGIRDTFIPYIFEPFRQEHMGDDRPYEGVGLGLTITKRLVDLMNGEISVESKPSKGSCFSIKFELLSGELDELLPRPRKPMTPESIALMPRFRVMVVEDNLETQMLINRLLKPLCQVTIVNSFDAAVIAFSQAMYDICLIDINLGEERTGSDLLKKLRSFPRRSLFYAVAFTAYALPTDRSRFISEGFDDYLPKPFVKADLLDLLQRVKETRAL